MQKYIAAGSIEGSANLKLKKKVYQNSHFFRMILKKMQELGFLGVTFVCKWLKILLQSEFSEKKSLT